MRLLKYLSNIPGWRTRRKIVVIESDDWGSVYMPHKTAFEALKGKGISLDSRYLKNDTLESNEDMEMLFDTIRKHKDSTGRCVVLTGVNVVANPDFEKIKANGFTCYEYELFTETAKRIPGCDRIYEFWQQGIRDRLLVPVFHGREHLNVQRWMRLLKQGNKTIWEAFNHEVPCVDIGLNGEQLPDLRAAFDIDSVADLPYLHEVITSGMKEFERLFGYRSTFFIPTNGPFNNSLEPHTADLGIKYIGTSKLQLEPLGNDKYKKHFRYLGQLNGYNQLYMTRNCFFEPGYIESRINKDWVNDCLHDIEIAFRCYKPAIISSHRVNYMGTLNPKNRIESLNKLDTLLRSILRKWPEVEFMTSIELGDLIRDE